MALSPCSITGKQKHTISKAKKHLIRLKKGNSNYKGTIFMCSYCKTYHIGTSKIHLLPKVKSTPIHPKIR